jgi:hypothetical protein
LFEFLEFRRVGNSNEWTTQRQRNSRDCRHRSSVMRRGQRGWASSGAAAKPWSGLATELKPGSYNRKDIVERLLDSMADLRAPRQGQGRPVPCRALDNIAARSRHIGQELSGEEPENAQAK